MRGSPLLRALLAFVIIAALGWPLWHLTRPETAAAPPPPSATPAVAKTIGLHLAFTTVPRTLIIKHLEKELWRDPAPTAEMEREVALAYPDEGVDLQFQIDWPEDGLLSAMRVQLTDPAGNTHEKSVWGRGTVSDVLTFP